MDSRALVDAFVEGSADGLWVLDLEGRTRYANRAMARMFSGEPDGPPPASAFDILDADGRSQFAELLERTRRGTYRGGESQETLFHDRHGHPFWVLVSDSLLHDDDGGVAGLVVRVTDFAESRRTRDALDRSRAALVEARTVGKVGSWRLDVATGVLSVPVAVGESADGDEVARTTLPEFLAGVHPHDREHAAAVIRDAVAEGDEFEFDVRVPRSEGWAWIRGRGVVHRDPDGTATSVSGTHRDVSEIKSAERALQIEMQRAQLVGLAAAAANEAGSFTEALRATRDLAAQHMLAERVSGWAATDGGLLMVVGEAGPDHETLARRAHADRATVWHDDDTAVAVPAVRQGTSYGVLVFESVEPLDHGATGASASTIGAQLGLVAARERTLRELVEARDAATAAAKEKTEFLATMSHEIRTPLNGIIGLTDLLLRTALDADQLRFSTGVQAASRDLLRVVTDVLDFSTIQAGRLQVEDIVFEPRDVLDVVTELTAPQAAEAGVDLVVSCHPEVPTRLTGDPARITQVLVNLASNAVRFGPGGEVLVHMRRDDDAGYAAPEDRVSLRVDVRDTGVGIDPGRVGEMFAPFTQADASHSRHHGGTGLGLALAREIAHALGGDLRHAPTPGGGSTFTLRASFPAPPSAAGSLDEYARSWLAGRRLLVVDHRPHHRSRLLDGTAGWGMRTEAVATVARARDAIRTAASEGDPVEALVVDLDTEDGAALALASELDADSGPVVLALASDRSVDMAQVRAAGVSVCLPQPVTGAVLRGTLLEQLAGVPARPLEARPERPSAQRRRILVVEDNPVNQLVATGLLASLGYDAEVADDGEAGLAALAVTPFDAVLMDVQMPGLDGYATTRALRERGLRLPVVALTAASVEGERQRCLDAGMDDFLTKPVDARALGETLRHWLGEDDDADEQDDEPAPVHPATGPIAGLDTERLDMLRDLDPGDTTYLDRAIGNFERNSVEAVATMRALAAEGDGAGLRAAAHKIAGSALNLGVVDAGALAREVELTAESAGVAAALPLLDGLEESFGEGRRLLAAYQATYSD